MTFVAGTTGERAAATLGPDGRWRTIRALRAGESAYVCAGDLRDAWGNFNGSASATAGPAAANVCAPVAVVGVPNDGSGNVPASAPGPAAESTSSTSAAKPLVALPKISLPKLK